MDSHRAIFVLFGEIFNSQILDRPGEVIEFPKKVEIYSQEFSRKLRQVAKGVFYAQKIFISFGADGGGAGGCAGYC